MSDDRAVVCQGCQSVHGSDATVAVGRFDPDGTRGYRSRLGNVAHPTRAEADAEYCGG